ncbi:hypothetical protein jhhlp_007059 [Lomentospora prolificans]|uniref:Ribosome biogenesis regulatory protein n=1 Tax=Lomentospora prolificans TaxID=41688 RepID=A0A2N3N1M9_9PEZI|nr:hypothetical protein jhhlp_007059 [Lomentospora prolificans]
MAVSEAPQKLPVAVNKPTPYTFDLGLLVATDPNPVSLPTPDHADPAASSAALEQSLAEIARDGAQALINQLLTTCPINATQEGVALTLPPISTPLPREKPLPQPKPMTKWQKFAAKKGIAPKTKEQRRNLVYDEEEGAWRPKWGQGGINKKGEDYPIVEVDMEKERQGKETNPRAEGRRERVERVKRNDRKMRKNFRQKEGKKK